MYFATNTNQAAQHYKTPALAPAPCVLRMKAGETRFDPTFMRSLDADVGTPLWGSFVAGPGDEVLTRVAPLTHPAIASAVAASEVNAADAWEWWATRPDAPPARKVPELPAGSGSTQAYVVDDRAYLVSYNDKDAKTTLIDPSPASGPRTGLSVPGYVYNVIRIR